MKKDLEATLRGQLTEQGMAPANQDRTVETLDLITSLNQGDKLFVFNQLGMKLDKADDFIPAVALWKKKGGGMVNWNFVMQMTDEAIAEELGFVDEDPKTDESV